MQSIPLSVPDAHAPANRLQQLPHTLLNHVDQHVWLKFRNKTVTPYFFNHGLIKAAAERRVQRNE